MENVHYKIIKEENQEETGCAVNTPTTKNTLHTHTHTHQTYNIFYVSTSGSILYTLFFVLFSSLDNVS